MPVPGGQDLGVPYQALRRGLLAFINRRIVHPAAAEDVLQEVFVKALLAIRRGGNPGNTNGWLYAITRNAIIDYYRAHRPDDALPNDLAAEEQTDSGAGQALATCLRPMIQDLPKIYRETLIATDLEGRSMQSLAAEQAVSVSAIKSRASRGRKRLKAALLACCEIELDQSGGVIDYHRRVQTGCDSCRSDPSGAQ